jgi:hypothetical protein
MYVTLFLNTHSQQKIERLTVMRDHKSHFSLMLDRGANFVLYANQVRDIFVHFSQNGKLTR